MRLAIAIVLGALAGAPALAGDVAEHRVLGFSPGGGVFAFEEFGVQDGSGFPYANVYAVDTRSDSWLPGTPVRVLLEDETAGLAAARRAAGEKAAPLLAEQGVEDRWRRLASSPLGEYGADPVGLDFGIPKPWNALEDVEERYRAELDLYHAAAPGQDCDMLLGDRPSGFRLRIVNMASGGETVLHEDASIPRSRGCPITYRLSEIVVPDEHPVSTVAVLVSLFRFGFEGPDRRFLAVTGRLPE